MQVIGISISPSLNDTEHRAVTALAKNNGLEISRGKVKAKRLGGHETIFVVEGGDLALTFLHELEKMKVGTISFIAPFDAINA